MPLSANKDYFIYTRQTMTLPIFIDLCPGTLS